MARVSTGGEFDLAADVNTTGMISGDGIPVIIIATLIFIRLTGQLL